MVRQVQGIKKQNPISIALGLENLNLGIIVEVVFTMGICGGPVENNTQSQEMV